MKYEEYEIALSAPRIGKYRLACKGDRNKALILYRYNIKLCQKFYGVLGVLEVVLRNAINEHFKTQLHDNNWLVTQAKSGFLVSYRDAIFKERDKLVNNGKYTHDKLVASLSLGAWTFMFSRNCYKNSGKTLLQIFPKKTHGLNQRDIYSDLDKIRSFRNRIAHHEPLCFDNTGTIDVRYVQELFSLIIKYIDFLGYNKNELLYGVENPLQTINKIDKLSIAKIKLITNRTILFPIDIEIMNAISNGTLNQLSEYKHNDEWPDDDLKEAFPVFEELLKKNGNDGFNIWLIIEKENNRIIGSAGFIGKPDDEGNIEIGFGIVPSRRGNGFCHEAVSALLRWGFNQDEVNGIIARCDKSNIASRKSIMKLGFKYFSEKDDLLIWKLEKKLK